MKSRKFSPVVRAAVRLSGAPPHSCVDVRFDSRDEIDTLIKALTELRDSAGAGPDHAHLQDATLGKALYTPGATEVIFNRPGKKPDEAEQDCIDGYAEFERKGQRSIKTVP